jgi:protein gp37
MSTKIEWTERTWNPVTGCTKISAGCKNCYAERMAKRLKTMGQVKYIRGFTPALHYGELDEPYHWRKPRMVFVCSMSDLFHRDVPDSFIVQVFNVMRQCSQHTFQLLTKRAERLGRLGRSFVFDWPQNVWAGVTIENREALARIKPLRHVFTQVRFLSCEPLLEDLGELDLDGIDWCICGGESGPGARPMHPDWARSIRDQCVTAGVPFLFKQVGGVNKKRAGRMLDGRTWDEMPEVTR